MKGAFNYNYGEAVTALALGLLLPVTAFGIRKVFRQRLPTTDSALLLTEISPSEVFSSDELTTITRAWNDDGVPEGKFLRDRHGFTRFVIDRPDNSSPASGKGLIVFAHGLGTSLTMYKELAGKFTKEGFSVLRYDYYGHGYSKFGGGDIFASYSPGMLVDQLEDVLEYVCDETKVEVVGIVGHSAGGVTAIACNDRWGNDGAKRQVIPKVCLACPAVYSKKPFVARVADRIPNILTFLFKYVKPLRFIIADAYLEAGEIAFGRDPETNVVIYKDEETRVVKTNNRLFGRVKGIKKHPFLEAGIHSLNCNSLREDLHPGARSKLLNVLRKTGNAKCDVIWAWGNLDMTVPYKENIDEVKGWADTNENLSLQILDRMGHEIFFENSTLFAEKILPFFKD